MRPDGELVDAAIDLATERWPTGESGAAAMYTDDGRTLTSVAVDSPNEGATLCHETGCICEAHKLNCRVVASVCVSRRSERDPFVILTPCGICQERLAYWGMDVSVAVPVPDDPTAWQARTLSEVQPHYWRSAVE